MQTIAARTREPTLLFLSGIRPLPVEPELGDAPALHAYGVTHEGNVRAKNEDQFLVAQTDRVVRVDWSSFAMERGSGWPVDRQAKILMVADGLGGHAQGELASAVVVDAMLDAVASIRVLPDEANLGEALRAAVERAQQRVLAVAERKALHFKPATTLTMAYISWPMMYVVHAGNSRAYLQRDRMLRQLTQDHTMASRLMEAGLPPEQAEHSRSRHVLVNAVGGGTRDLRVDVVPVRLVPGDRVLLCTDGLHDVLDDERIGTILEDAPDFMQAATDLVTAALGAGSTDNVTAVVMHARP